MHLVYLSKSKASIDLHKRQRERRRDKWKDRDWRKIQGRRREGRTKMEMLKICGGKQKKVIRQGQDKLQSARRVQILITN